MSTITLGEAIARHNVEVHDHLDRNELLPVHTGLQIQGDVAFIPTRPSAKTGGPVPAVGIALVAGENGGHTHLLLAEGAVTFAPAIGDNLDVGVITVADNATAYVAHPEHGYLAVGAGSYLVRRQREMADEIRRVAD